MKRKATLLVLAGLLVVGCFAGCKSESEPTAQPGTAEQEAIPSIEVPADEPADGESAELELPDQGEPIEGIVTAGQPSMAQFDQLREAGYRTVINLRTDGEPGTFDEARKALEEKVVYEHIPIGGPDDLTRENVEKLDAAIKAGEEKGKILIHCGTSKRVGALLALRAAWIEGKSAEEAMALGKKAGMSSLESAVEAKLAESE